jgi:hypothetical protein
LSSTELAEVLVVYTGAPPSRPGAGSEQPAVAGKVALTAAGLQFTPRFPFVSGLDYTVFAALNGVSLRSSFRVAPPGGDSPRVVAVFPSGTTLPANTLRMYVHFSQGMNARQVHDHIRLLDAQGAVVPLAFVEVAHGLWNAAATRLTLFFHPGRVKRGVAPGDGLGPVLSAGRSYRLVIDGTLTNAAGRPLGADFSHAFTAADDDRVSPDAARVGIAPPRNAADALLVALPEPLDEALLRRFVWVEDASGSAVAGEIAVGDGETRWRFQPREPWKSGAYSLRILPALEDRAGNRFDRLFDRSTVDGDEEGAAERATSPLVPLSFPFRFP